jgi:hypothetical protein
MATFCQFKTKDYNKDVWVNPEYVAAVEVEAGRGTSGG